MSKKIYSEADLQDLISKVEVEFNQHLAKAQEEAQTLAKSEEIEKCGEMTKADEDAKPVEAQPEESQSQESHDYSDEDKEELKKLYADMSDAERSLHKAALEACESKDGELHKSEETVVQETKTEESETAKNEELELAKSEIEKLKKSNEETKAQFESLVKSLSDKLVSRPVPKRQAVTELGSAGVLKKSEETKPLPNREEAKKILARKVREESLTKHEREAINAFTIGATGIETISHLLK